MFRFEYYLRWRLHGRFLKFCNSWLSSVQAGSRMFLSIDHECLKMEETSKNFWKRSIFPLVFYSIWWVTSEFFSFLIENWAFGLLKNNLCLAGVSHRTIHVFHVSSNPPVTVNLQYYLSPNSSVVSWILITKFWLCPAGAFPSSIDHLNCFIFYFFYLTWIQGNITWDGKPTSASFLLSKSKNWLSLFLLGRQQAQSKNL